MAISGVGRTKILQGPQLTPTLPKPPNKESDVQGIVEYLRDLDAALRGGFQGLVTSAVGILGVRGLSSTGIGASNFTKTGLPIGGVMSASWVFTNAEINASYMILESVTSPSYVIIATMIQQTTQLLIGFGMTTPLTSTMNLVLLR